MELTKVRKIMSEKKITGPALAKMIQTPYRTVDDFLRRGSGNFILLYKISRALGTTMDALVDDDGEHDVEYENKASACPIHEILLFLTSADRESEKGNTDLALHYRNLAFTKISALTDDLNDHTPDEMMKYVDNSTLTKYLGLLDKGFSTENAVSFIKYHLLTPMVDGLCNYRDSAEDENRLQIISTVFAENDCTESAIKLAQG
jgi:hypothetical protein